MRLDMRITPEVREQLRRVATVEQKTMGEVVEWLLFKYISMQPTQYIQCREMVKNTKVGTTLTIENGDVLAKAKQRMSVEVLSQLGLGEVVSILVWQYVEQNYNLDISPYVYAVAEVDIKRERERKQEKHRKNIEGTRQRTFYVRETNKEKLYQICKQNGTSPTAQVQTLLLNFVMGLTYSASSGEKVEILPKYPAGERCAVYVQLSGKFLKVVNEKMTETGWRSASNLIDVLIEICI